MKLKETIDRMRYEMDQLRTSQVLSKESGGGSGVSSTQGSLSRSLGMELSRMNIPNWPRDGDDSGDEVEMDEENEDEETDREDVLETIITRRTVRDSSSLPLLSFPDMFVLFPDFTEETYSVH